MNGIVNCESEVGEEEVEERAREVAREVAREMERLPQCLMTRYLSLPGESRISCI